MLASQPGPAVGLAAMWRRVAYPVSAERLFSAASRAHHDLKASMGDMSLEHQLLALANTD